MSSIVKIFGGLVLLAAGITIIYESSIYHLIDIFIIFGIVLVIIGAYLLILSFFERGKISNLKNFQKNNKKPKNGILEGNINNNGSDNKNNKNLNKATKKNALTSALENNLSNNKLGAIDTDKIKNKVKNSSKKKNPKSVLTPIDPKPNENNKKFRFTPNYEKPMKVNRRPKKKSKLNLINEEENSTLSENKNNFEDKDKFESGGVKKSEAVAKALASDDFIRPIHNDSKLYESNISNPNDKLYNKLENIENKDHLSDINDIKDINDLGNIKDINNIENIDNIKNISELNAADGDLDNIDGDLSKKLSNNESFSKFSRSYVVCSKGAMTSKEAFEELAKKAKKEMLLKINSIKDIDDDKFLSKLSSLNVKIIIQEFDIKNMSHVLLITSLLEQGIEIKTLSSIDTINLIADESNALVIYDNNKEDLDVGAVYNDSKSISKIKSMFEKSWEIANNLKINNFN